MAAKGKADRWSAFLAVAMALPLHALAQTGTIQLELARCAAIADINARVACYDALANTRQNQPQSAVPAVPRTQVPEEAQAKPVADARNAQTLLARVTQLREVQPGKMRITLANGQVWQQTVAKAFFIRTNDTVRIDSSGWGRSFRLTIDGHPEYIQVSRLR